jgi:thiamine biosynthesis lipoprotein
MTCCSRTAAEAPPSDEVHRARPLLGTLVAVRVAGLPREAANAAIDRAFAEVTEFHRLMSFHEAASDLSRLNREAARGPVEVDRRTLAVLRAALDLAQETNGLFDPTVGGALVERGALPNPDACAPHPAASWRDVAILADGRVTFAHPLWLDFGGIAKGHAVDAALAAMALPETARVVIDAGGDLRVAGPGPEMVRLAVPAENEVPIVALEDGALASSTSVTAWGARFAAHVDGRTRRAVGTDSFAAVAAPNCGIADALTKPTLALGAEAEPLLRRHGAQAYLYSDRHGWRILGGSE